MSRKSKISVISKDPAVPRHRGAFLIEGVPDDTRQAFKSACAKKAVTMRDAIITFMRQYAQSID